AAGMKAFAQACLVSAQTGYIGLGWSSWSAFHFPVIAKLTSEMFKKAAFLLPIYFEVVGGSKLVGPDCGDIEQSERRHVQIETRDLVPSGLRRAFHRQASSARIAKHPKAALDTGRRQGISVDMRIFPRTEGTIRT